ncbi:hypothetical protein Pst134EB_014602 [Puccinia striiformis f. sp. tritici]|nr:hypothetical protein Pst134EB_014602 [Puccinia striiformis f. sp. tritici]
MPVGRHVTKLSKEINAVLPKLRREHIRLQFRNPDNATETVGLAQNSALTLYHLKARNIAQRSIFRCLSQIRSR